MIMEFLEICLSFPVIIFTGLLILACLYWVVAAMGLLDIDTLDLDIDPGGGGDIGDVGDVGDAGPDLVDGLHGGMGAVASLLFHLGLYGVPMTLILTFIFLVGWFVAHLGFSLVLGPWFEPGLIRYLLGLVLMGLAFMAGALATSVMIRPLRPLFKKAPQVTRASLRGKTVVIRSSQVTDTYGEAVYEDGGAGMLLDVRPATAGRTFKRGETAVVLEYDEARRLYTIITEDEFRGR